MHGSGGRGGGVCASVYRRFGIVELLPRNLFHLHVYTRGEGEGAYTWKQGGGKGVRGPPPSFLHRNRLYDITPAGGSPGHPVYAAAPSLSLYIYLCPRLANFVLYAPLDCFSLSFLLSFLKRFLSDFFRKSCSSLFFLAFYLFIVESLM